MQWGIGTTFPRPPWPQWPREGTGSSWKSTRTPRAKSDGKQSLNLAHFESLLERLRRLSVALEVTLV